MNRPSVLFFDVNRTLLDTHVLREPIGRALGGRPELLELWFSTLLHCSLVESATGHFRPFPELAAAALVIVARKHEIGLNLQEATKAVAPMRSLPPFPDVEAGLDALKTRGYTLVALTNSSRSACTEQLERSALAHFFTRQLSVEEIRIYKPHLEVYRWAAQQMVVPVGDALMVAAHGWDTVGAQMAGMRSAFLARPHEALHPLADPPQFTIKTLPDLAVALETEEKRVA